jgi:anaerobic magnesium-protoporphyrin IX monomethyl ester cyclase
MLMPLIILPSPFLTDPKTIMPLGVLYIGTAIRFAGHECVVIDLGGVENYTEYTINELTKYKKELTKVGISITTSQAQIARELTVEIRKHFPGIKIIVGGPHVTHAMLAHNRIPIRTQNLVDDIEDNYDVYVIGDAEKAIIQAFDPDSPKRIDASHKLSPHYVDDVYLNEIPFPDRSLLDVKSYHYNMGMVAINENNAINIMSQRGCPYTCRFCASRMDKYGRLLRKTDRIKVIDEIRHLYHTYGYTDYTFYDDELNVNPKLGTLLDSLKDLQMEVGQEFRFRSFVKSNIVTEQQMKNLAEAGFKVVATGAESGSERILTNMAKRSTKDHNTRCVEWAHKYGIYSKSIMSLGHPGESPETLAETEKWLDEVQLTDVNFTIISALPSSAYFDSTKFENGVWVYTAPETGDKLYDEGIDWTKTVHFYNGDPSLDYEATVFTDYLSKQDLIDWHTYLENKYKEQKIDPNFNSMFSV